MHGITRVAKWTHFQASGAEGDRTLNLSIANAALSQLSYRPGRWVILHQSNVENASTQAKIKGVAAVQHGPDTGLVQPCGTSNQERMTHDRKLIRAPLRGPCGRDHRARHFRDRTTSTCPGAGGPVRPGGLGTDRGQ